jgi:hypothetical protein
MATSADPSPVSAICLTRSKGIMHTRTPNVNLRVHGFGSRTHAPEELAASVSIRRARPEMHPL